MGDLPTKHPAAILMAEGGGLGVKEKGSCSGRAPVGPEGGFQAKSEPERTGSGTGMRSEGRAKAGGGGRGVAVGEGSREGEGRLCGGCDGSQWRETEGMTAGVGVSELQGRVVVGEKDRQRTGRGCGGGFQRREMEGRGLQRRVFDGVGGEGRPTMSIGSERLGAGQRRAPRGGGGRGGWIRIEGDGRKGNGKTRGTPGLDRTVTGENLTWDDAGEDRTADMEGVEDEIGLQNE